MQSTVRGAWRNSRRSDSGDVLAAGGAGWPGIRGRRTPPAPGSVGVEWRGPGLLDRQKPGKNQQIARFFRTALLYVLRHAEADGAFDHEGCMDVHTALAVGTTGGELACSDCWFAKPGSLCLEVG
jgi:hypothetical protein